MASFTIYCPEISKGPLSLHFLCQRLFIKGSQLYPFSGQMFSPNAVPLGTIHLRHRQIFTIFDPYPLKNANVLDGWSLSCAFESQSNLRSQEFLFWEYSKWIWLNIYYSWVLTSINFALQMTFGQPGQGQFLIFNSMIDCYCYYPCYIMQCIYEVHLSKIYFQHSSLSTVCNFMACTKNL